ncbi:MAG: hypothetical protein ACOC4I_03850 [Spirochaetota bacterium]
MKAAGLLTLLTVLCTLPAPASELQGTARPGAPGNAELHVAAGISVALVAGGVHTNLHDNRASSALTGAALALTIGIAKEVADALGFGTPSIADALLTAVGGAAGAGALYLSGRHAASVASRRTTGTGAALSGLTFSVPVLQELIDRIQRM